MSGASSTSIPVGETDEARPGVSALSIWGVAPVDLHDALWASRCVQVVRPGTGSERVARGPALYLLLRSDQLVLHHLDLVLKRMHWASPRLVRLRVITKERSGYSERVLNDDDGIRFSRSYRHAVRRSDRAWLTADPTLARLWAGSDDAQSAKCRLRDSVDRASILSVSIDGLSTHTTAGGIHEWAEGALEQWKRPNVVFPGIYEYQPGVWIHESSVIGEHVRVIGDVWIGAGVELDEAMTLVGPLVLGDRPNQLGGPSPTPGNVEVDWELTRSPHWSLPALSGAASLRRTVKRLFDLVFSLAVLICTLPLYPVVMIAIALEDGRPFFFAHRRQTLGGREFPCLKFRTMRKDAEKIKAELVKQNAADGPQFFMANDPRVTKVGRYLRKFQIDEFPQFLNVLAGQMSVVGPRPSPDKENQFCPTWREARLSVRPGVTGLWQVKRTREPLTDFQEWIRYDLEYVQHQSFVGDLRIIAETVKQIVF